MGKTTIEKARASRRKYYYKNKETHYLRNEIAQKKVKEFVRSQKKPCILCGESEMICIDFHHLKDKRDNVSAVHNYGSIKRAEEEIKKCVCLCANCHRKLHAGLVTLNTSVV